MAKKHDDSRREFLSKLGVLFALPFLPEPVSANAAKGEALPPDDWMARIIASPDDEALRLAYADWLTQAGNPLGEHIRLECALGSLDSDMPGYYTADARRARLAYEGKKWFESRFSKWHDASSAKVSRKSPKTVFFSGLRRGAIEELTIDDAELFLEHWQEILTAAPLIRYVRVEQIEDSEVLQRLLVCPALSRVRELAFEDCELDLDALGAWTAGTQCQDLREIEFSFGKLDAEGLTRLLESGKFPELTSLSLQGPEFMDEEGHDDDSQLLKAIFCAPAFPKLSRIDFAGCSFLGSAAAGELNRQQRQLTSISLDISRLSKEDVTSFLAVRREVLRSLKLFRGECQGLRPILGKFPRLEEVILGDLRLDDQDLDSLASSAPATLRKLSVKGGTVATIDVLARSRHLQNVRFLDLGDNRIESMGVEVLAKSNLLSQLVVLRLGWNKIDARGARAIASSPKSEGLRFLHLGDNLIGDEGVQSLATSTHLGRLNWLNIDGSGASDASVLAILDSPHLAGLNALRADNSDRGGEIEQRLADRFGAFDMIANYGFYGRLI